jgi:hypothetical protein
VNANRVNASRRNTKAGNNLPREIRLNMIPE